MLVFHRTVSFQTLAAPQNRGVALAQDFDPLRNRPQAKGLSIEAGNYPLSSAPMQGSFPIGIVAKHVIVFPIKTDDLWAQGLKGTLHSGLVG